MRDQAKTTVTAKTAPMTLYDCGSYDTVVDTYLDVDVVPERDCKQLLLYPTTDCLVKLNDSEKTIFLPAEAWTPIGIVVESFNVKAVETAGKVHWQGWF